MEEAGYSILGEGSNAWDVVALEEHFYFWARQATDMQPNFLAQEGYDVHLEYGLGVVHSNGVRLVWEAQGLYVFIGEFGGLSESLTQKAEALLGASLRTPYPPPP